MYVCSRVLEYFLFQQFHKGRKKILNFFILFGKKMWEAKVEFSKM